MSVEIFFDDLSEEKQKEVLEEAGYIDVAETNWNIFSLCVFEVDEKVRKEIIEEHKV